MNEDTEGWSKENEVYCKSEKSPKNRNQPVAIKTDLPTGLRSLHSVKQNDGESEMEILELGVGLIAGVAPIRLR
jgi:hypothetical protein